MAKKEKKIRKKGQGIWAEFKAFMSRGNVLDMAVGVVIGAAFSAIVTAVVDILLSLCTWGLPGGLNGLITILPALNAAQGGLNPSVTATYEGATVALEQFFPKGALQDLATALAISKYGDAAVASTPTLIDNAAAAIKDAYTLYGTTYGYKMSAIINWGAVINAIIKFIIIGITLFVIVKTVNWMAKKREELKVAAQEAYYKKHPEERPVPPDPEKPEPTDHELLKEMLKIMKENQAKDK